jgi:hypothetical protein
MDLLHMDHSTLKKFRQNIHRPNDNYFYRFRLRNIWRSCSWYLTLFQRSSFNFLVNIIYYEALLLAMNSLLYSSFLLTSFPLFQLHLILRARFLLFFLLFLVLLIMTMFLFVLIRIFTFLVLLLISFIMLLILSFLEHSKDFSSKYVLILNVQMPYK